MNKFLIGIILLITGCVSPNYGNQNLSTELIQKSITNGKTTKQDLIEAFGKPETITTTTGGQAVPNNFSKAEVKEVWNYYKMTKEGFASISMLTMAVYLDKDGRVLDYVVTEKQ